MMAKTIIGLAYTLVILWALFYLVSNYVAYGFAELAELAL